MAQPGDSVSIYVVGTRKVNTFQLKVIGHGQPEDQAHVRHKPGVLASTLVDVSFGGCVVSVYDD